MHLNISEFLLEGKKLKQYDEKNNATPANDDDSSDEFGCNKPFPICPDL